MINSFRRITLKEPKSSFTRLVISAFNAVVPEHKFRVVAPDVGGGFGQRFIPSEDAIAWAAKKVQRPVKWVAQRTESFFQIAMEEIM